MYGDQSGEFVCGSWGLTGESNNLRSGPSLAASIHSPLYLPRETKVEPDLGLL